MSGKSYIHVGGDPLVRDEGASGVALEFDLSQGAERLHGVPHGPVGPQVREEGAGSQCRHNSEAQVRHRLTAHESVLLKNNHHAVCDKMVDVTCTQLT